MRERAWLVLVPAAVTLALATPVVTWWLVGTLNTSWAQAVDVSRVTEDTAKAADEYLRSYPRMTRWPGASTACA